MITNKYFSSASLLIAIFSIVIFACDVTNTDNQTQTVAPVTNLQALTYSNTNTLYASWSPSSTPDLVQYYLLEITSSSDASIIRSERIYSNSITSFRTGLIAGTYTVSIIAVAANSQSTVATSSAVTIVTAATAPTVVNPVASTITTTINGDLASITIPAPTGGTSGTETDGATPAKIVGYTLYYKQGSTVALNNYDNKVYITKAQVDASQSPIIDLLKPATMYAFRIAIHNSAEVLGVGDIFTVTTAAKPANNLAKAPSAPTNVQAQASLTEHKITVSWSASASAGKRTDGSDDTLTKYTVYWEVVSAITPSASRNSKNTISVNSSATTITLTTNIDVAKPYSVIVLAENTAGLYAVSNAVQTIPAATDKATPISAVTFDSTQAGDITTNSMIVRWTTDISKALTPQGVALTNNQVQFTIYYAEKPTPAYTTVAQVIEAATAKNTIVNIAAVATAAAAITNSTTITGLNMGTAYQVVIRAINTTAISLLTNSVVQNFNILLDLDQLTISYEDTVLYLEAASVSISPTISRIIKNDDNAITYSIAHKSGDATAATVQIDAKSGALQLDAKKLSASSIVYTIQVNPTADKAIGTTKTIDYTILGIDEAACNLRLVKNGNVYEISEPKDLFLITSTGLDKAYSLKNDITIPATDLSCYSYIDPVTNTIKFGATTQRTISFSNFEPIGNATDKFTGSFNGNNHTISGLKINKSTISNIGLFGYIENATIQNLVIDHEGIQGRENVGALAGRTTNSTITNAGMKSSNASTISGTSNNIGGLVGYVTNQSTVSGYATGAVNGNGYVGGLVGYVGSKSTVSGYATGAVSGTNWVGGLVGGVDASTVSGYATGAVSGTGDNVGGLAGYAITSSRVSGYATGAVSGTNWVGGLVGGVDHSSTVSGYATGAVSGTNNIGGLAGYTITSSRVSGYARGTVTRSSGANTTFGLLTGEGTATGYHSANESSFGGITISVRTGIDGTAITMGATITQADFNLLDFKTDVGKWTWVPSTNGKWPAINLGFSTELSAKAPGDLPNEQ